MADFREPSTIPQFTNRSAHSPTAALGTIQKFLHGGNFGFVIARETK